MINLFIDRFIAALRFLTIIPVPGKRGADGSALAGSLWFFPLVGILLGAIAGGLFYLISPLLPGSLAAVLAVTLLAVFSGGLHLDGVADCADGFFSSRPRERVLEIMRDSHIGPMGVIALVLLLSLKIAALAAVPSGRLWQPLLLMPIAGRSGILLMMAILPYARPEGGLATIFYGVPRYLQAAWAIAILLAVSWLVAAGLGVLATANALIFILPFFLYCYMKIGGATGDTLGAACEISETFSAVAFAGLLH